MATVNIAIPAICTTKMRWEDLQVQGVAPTSFPVRRPSIVNALLRSSCLSKSRKPLAGNCQTSCLSLLTVHSRTHRQFVARAAAGDEVSPSVRIPNDEQPLSRTEETRKPLADQPEHSEDQAHEPLRIGEENSLPFGPAGGRQYDEPDPNTKLSEAEPDKMGIFVEDAHLSPLPVNAVRDFDRKQVGGWSESSYDEGSMLSSNKSAAPGDVVDMANSTGSSKALLIERLLECLPIYDRGQSPINYRIRAVVYGKIGEYFNKGEGKERRNGVEDNKHSRIDAKVLTPMQQLTDLILAEEGRSAADYNCRSRFFQDSYEIFCRAENSSRGSEESGEQATERVLQQLEDVMLRDGGRSIADYNRRATVFGKTADVVSTRNRGATTIN